MGEVYKRVLGRNDAQNEMSARSEFRESAPAVLVGPSSQKKSEALDRAGILFLAWCLSSRAF